MILVLFIIIIFYFVGDCDIFKMLKSEEELVEYGIDKVASSPINKKTKATERLGKFNRQGLTIRPFM